MWTFGKEGIKLEWRWKCLPADNSQKITVAVLDFLMDSNIKLSDEVVWKTQSFNKLKLEAEKCLEQSERLSSEKMEFESDIYGKFVNILNSKKAKLRELRDRLSKRTSPPPSSDEEGQSTDKTESFDEASDEDAEEDAGGSSKDVLKSKPRGRKRK